MPLSRAAAPGISRKTLAQLTDLSGRPIIVTGAGRPADSTGLGFEASRRLAEAGASITVNDVDGARAHETVEILTREGHRAMAVVADVTQRSQVERMVAETVREFGRVDGLVNNAAIYPKMQFLDLTDQHGNRMMEVNLLAPVLTSQIVARNMISQGVGGSIVNVISAAVLLPMHDHFMAYTVSKTGLQRATRDMAKALAPHRIRVNNLIPGAMSSRAVREGRYTGPPSDLRRTALTDGRTDPDNQARGILFLMSDLAELVTGADLSVDGGVPLLSG